MQLRPYQVLAAEQIREAMRTGAQGVVLQVATGAGKCLAAGTRVLTYDGKSIAVENVRVGDLLIGPDSQTRTVLSLAHGAEQMYRVTPNRGDSYTVNESHILSLKMTGNSRGGYTKGEIVNISVRDYLSKNKTFKHCAKGWKTPLNFKRSQEPLLVPPYILGAWLGDGSSRHFSITTGDQELIDVFSDYAESLGCRVRIEQNSKNSINLHIVEGKKGAHGGMLVRALRYYHLICNKHIPEQYKRASVEQRFQLLAGIMDTDGHWTGKGFELTLKSEQLMDDVIFVARSLGLSAFKKQVSKVCGNNGKRGTYFRCHINGPVHYIECKLKRKQAPPPNPNKDNLLTGISVEPVGLGEYFGFTLTGDGLFVLADFTVTHNTVIASDIIRSAAAKHRNVLFLAHRGELLRQCSHKLTAFGVPHGTIKAGFPARNAQVQVASVQTIVRRVENMRWVPHLIIVDEAHLSAAASYKAILDAWPQAHVIGLSATPSRLDGRGLGRVWGGHFDAIVEGPAMIDLILAGNLAPIRCFGSAVTIDTKGVGKMAGDYNQAKLAVAADKPTITGCAVDHYTRLCKGRPALAFCVNVAHATHVAKQFREAGYRAVHVDGGMDEYYISSVLQNLGSGQLDIVVSVALLVEGIDVPTISCIIDLAPTQSLTRYLQKVGRGMRVADGKADCILLDHAGNVSRHGLPDEPREWTLDGRDRKGKGEKNEVNLRICPRCYAANVARALSCRECGEVFTAKEREAPKQTAGELKEIARVESRAEHKKQRAEQGAARTLEQLIEIGKARGYKNPAYWAGRVYAGRQA